MDGTDVVSIGGLGVVTVFIGLNKTPFTVHCDFLCRASSYFENQIPAGKRLTANGLKYPINKINEDPRIADIFFQWIYTREYSLGGDVSQGTLPDACLTQAIRLYCFAIKFGVPDLSLKILEELFGLMHKKRIQFNCSQLELVWEAEFTDFRIQNLVLLYIAYAEDILSYDEDMDAYNWLRDHGSIAVDFFRMLQQKYTNPNAGNPFDQPFAHKTFGEVGLQGKGHERKGGQPNKPSQHPIQQKDDRTTGDKVLDAQRKSSEEANNKQKSNPQGGDDQQSSDKGAGHYIQCIRGICDQNKNTENGHTQDAATEGSTNQSSDVRTGNARYADAQNGGGQSDNKRKLGVTSSKDTSASKKARRRSDGSSGSSMDGVTPESSQKELRRNPARRTAGCFRPYRGKV